MINMHAFVQMSPARDTLWTDWSRSRRRGHSESSNDHHHLPRWISGVAASHCPLSFVFRFFTSFFCFFFYFTALQTRRSFRVYEGRYYAIDYRNVRHVSGSTWRGLRLSFQTSSVMMTKQEERSYTDIYFPRQRRKWIRRRRRRRNKKKRKRERGRFAAAHGSDFVPRRGSIFGEACPLKPRRHTDYT